MNSISWFLYIADVVGNLRGLLVGVAIACIAFCVLCLIGQGIAEGELSENCPNMWKRWWQCAPTAVIFLLIAIFIPSQNTLYAIAASEVGERVVKNEKVQDIASDATKALHQWIKRQIEPEKKS